MRTRPWNDVKEAIFAWLGVAISLWLLLLPSHAAGQAQPIGARASSGTPTLFWSQVDTFVGISPAVDFMFLASGSHGRDGTHPEIVFGPNIDIALWNFLTHLKTSNPERSRYLTFRIGYRYAKSLYNRENADHVGVLELTPRVPLPLGFQIADRNRIDLQGLPENFNWRYATAWRCCAAFRLATSPSPLTRRPKFSTTAALENGRSMPTHSV